VLSDDMYKQVSDTIPQNVHGIEHLIEKLKPGIEYQFRIRGYIEDQGWQNWKDGLVSNVFKTVNTEPSKPSPPYDKMGASTATGVVLKWEAGPSNGKAITEFELYWKKNEGEFEPFQSTTWPTLPVEGLEVGFSYVWKVRAKNEIGWSEFSDHSHTISTNPIPIPGVPKSVKYGIGWVELQWQKPNGHMLVTAYELQSKRSDLNKWETETKSCKKEVFLVQDLRPCAHYLFRVRALTFDGWSSYSVESEPFTTVRRH